MKSEVTSRLELLVRNSLLIDSSISALSGDGFSELEIRALIGEVNRPSGWFIKVTNFNQLTLYDFGFDDSAKDWNDFYFVELFRNFDSWEESLKSMIEKDFRIEFSLDGLKVTAADIKSKSTLGRLGISGNLRLADNAMEDTLGAYLNSIRDFVGFCVLPLIPSDAYPSSGSSSEVMSLPEGAVTKVLVNKYERNPKNRAACLAHFGFTCFCCGFDFGSFYGEFANAYIHVHHITPVSKMGENYQVDPIRDLIPLCPNCHAAIHIQDPPLTPEKLKEMVDSRSTEMRRSN